MMSEGEHMSGRAALRRGRRLLVLVAAALIVTLGAAATQFDTARGVEPDAVLTVADVARANQSESLNVRGYLVFDYTACPRNGPLDGLPNAPCSGLWLWEHEYPDPWYGGAVLAIAADAVTDDLATLVTVREWGTPVTLAGRLVEPTLCAAGPVCTPTLGSIEVLDSGAPVPDRIATDDRVGVSMANQEGDIPLGWSLREIDGQHWTVNAPDHLLTYSIEQLPAPIPVDATDGVVKYYAANFKDVHSIHYEYTDSGPVWFVELGSSYETRTTVAGYNAGVTALEVTYRWAGAGDQVAAGLDEFKEFALSLARAKGQVQ